MRKILYILLILLVAVAMVFGREPKTTAQHSLMVRSADPQLPAQSLQSAVGIISARLKTFGLDGSEVQSVPGQKEIRIVLKDLKDYNYVLKLVTRKGKLEFYETVPYHTVASQLDAAKLLALMHTKAPSPNSPELGCTSAGDKAKVDEFLETAGSNRECRFLWNDLFEDQEVCLYAMKITGGKGAVLSGSDIGHIGIRDDSDGKQGLLDIEFRDPITAQWAEITRRNIGHAIAIVLDNQVVFAPVVQSEITGGKCQISGKFTSAQLKYLAAMAGNGELPVEFHLEK